jgi:hypothetical protein
MKRIVEITVGVAALVGMLAVVLGMLFLNAVIERGARDVLGLFWLWLFS